MKKLKGDQNREHIHLKTAGCFAQPPRGTACEREKMQMSTGKCQCARYNMAEKEIL